MTAICRVVKFVLRQSLGIGQDTSVKLVPAVQINNKEITFACNATSPMSYSQKNLLEYTVIYIFTLLNQIFVYEILKIN